MPSSDDLGRICGNVPTDSTLSVCTVCRGPVTPGFSLCFGCDRLLGGRRVPQILQTSVVPISTALQAGEWYGMLKRYKRGYRTLWPSLVGVIDAFVGKHEEELEENLGGAVDSVVVVPSKRGIAMTKQPLVHVVRRSRFLGEKVADALRFRRDATLPRWKYDPTVFKAGDVAVSGRRILLVEDTWVTGATCLSAAGALRDLGARRVITMPIGRCIDEEFWRGRAPDYLEAAARSYEPTWPR